MIAQTEFDEKENKLTIAHNKELIAKQRTETQLTVIICFLLTLLVVGLFVVLRNKQRMNFRLDQRVAEWTRELESNKTALARAYHEQNELIAKTSQSVKSALATQKGLNATISDDDIARANAVALELASLDKELSRIKKKEG